jgi:hypothetical protein
MDGIGCGIQIFGLNHRNAGHHLATRKFNKDHQEAAQVFGIVGLSRFAAD